ncbi:MAG: glycosyltransferase family 2 protein [Selenomonadaceae bacterium]|nr:glycosyltransferase family 2 protein [Selenomonadaceae bacterium]
MRIYLSAQKKYAYPVSVIIPMYNAEEFIAECLDSLLIQTFQDFEVIVIDDCSTDSSPSIVESYAPKFNGRLKLTKTKKNSGGGGYIPRNIGINLARGEFIQFIDADDFILGTALEILYNAAMKYNADVVYTSSHYILNAPDNVSLHMDGFSKSLLKKDKEVNPFFKLDAQQENLNRLLFAREGEFHTCWSKFYRKDFLIKNKIFFPTDMPHSGDFIFVINVYCHAKRFLNIPTSLYFYRHYNDSVTRNTRTPEELLLHWGSAFVGFFKNLYELERNNEVLSENPLYCLAILKNNLRWRRNRTAEARKTLGEENIYKTLHKGLVKNSSDSSTMLLPFFFTSIDSEIKAKNYSSGIVNKFKQYFTARLDIKLITDAGDFQIVSVSDDKAKVKNPDWLQKGGIGYVIQSYTGKLEIVAKATVSGKFKLKLRGMAVSDSEDKTKRIPYWIDYTKLTVNDQVIFDSLTSAWHDKPYLYNMNKVNAGDEIKIQVEWLPHRSDI